MERSLRFRVHEWLAEHVRWVQYPNVRVVSPPRNFWTYQMPWEQRLLIGFLSLVIFVAALWMLVVMGVFAWAFLSSL